ncbi:MAG TPA: ABC transporter permease [Solirubrobacteraceae bacterium]|jgi:peptide/nickel transport system permease protein
MIFLARRLGFYLIAAWVAVTVNFFIPRLMPGNPVELVFQRVRHSASPAALHALSVAFGVGIHESLVSQYVSYLGQLVHGNLGISITYFPSSVASVISGALPWTLALVGVGTVLSFILGTLLGMVAATRRGTWVDALLPITAFLSAVPYFWLGLVVLTVFGVSLHWFPLSGGYSPTVNIGFTWAFISNAVGHAVLPAVTIIVSSIAGWLLGMRNVMVSTLGEDYVLLAEAKGLRNRRVTLAYAARNAILPNVAGFALSLGFVVSGAILTEVVFSYPGIGYVLFEAVTNEDFPLMQGIFLMITILVLLANLLADAAYVLLDPRTREVQ